MGVAGGKQHTKEVWEPKYSVLSADPSSSERGLPCCAHSPHSCSGGCRVKGGGGRPRLAEKCKRRHHPPACSSGTRLLFSARARIHVQLQTPPPNPLQERLANPVTAAEATPREKRRSAEDPRKEEGACSLPRERQMWGS